jgi:uncharacterized protein
MKTLLAALAMLGAAACGPAEAGRAEKARTPQYATGSQPRLTGRVVDTANLIDDRSEQALSLRLEALEKATSDQMVVVTVPSLSGQSIESYALALGNRWRIGREDVDNGVIILVAPTERKVRVEVGLGLEGLLTDAKAGEVSKAVLPRFGAGDYAGGIGVAVDQIDQVLRSDRRRPQPKPVPEKEAA